MAELADAPDLGSGVYDVQVQVLSSAFYLNHKDCKGTYHSLCTPLAEKQRTSSFFKQDMYRITAGDFSLVWRRYPVILHSNDIIIYYHNSFQHGPIIQVYTLSSIQSFQRGPVGCSFQTEFSCLIRQS